MGASHDTVGTIRGTIRSTGDFGRPTLDGPARPPVSIGMPVYNGAGTVRRAIAAILAQRFPDFELIVSDNASTDETIAICSEFAGDPRVRLIRQPRNLGALANFGHVLAQARGTYFMFAAADDWIEPQFLDETLPILRDDPSVVACVPRTMIHFADGRSREAIGVSSIKGSAIARPARFLLRPADNSRFYGLYRIDVMRRAFGDPQPVHGIDWAISALTLAEGAHVKSKSILLHRQGAEPGKYHWLLIRGHPGWFARIFPVGEMSALVLGHLPPPQRPLAFLSLVVLNAAMTAEFAVARLRAMFAKVAV